MGGQTVLSETFLVDYKGDLYGKNLIVEFYHFVRGEKKFGSLEELRAAIEDSTRKSVELCENTGKSLYKQTKLCYNLLVTDLYSA